MKNLQRGILMVLANYASPSNMLQKVVLVPFIIYLWSDFFLKTVWIIMPDRQKQEEHCHKANLKARSLVLKH